MSTKIYNAFKFKGTHEELIPFLVKIRKDVIQELVETYKNYHLDEFDTVALMRKIESSIDKCEDSFNIESNVCVFHHNGQIYLQFFFPSDLGRYLGQGQKIIDMWADNIEDFHYQDQVDKPDEISEDDWDHRKEVWNEIFNIDCRPGYAGLIWNILGKSDSYSFVLSIKS